MRRELGRFVWQGAILALCLLPDVCSASTTTECTVTSTTSAINTVTAPASTITAIVTQTYVATTYHVISFRNGTISTSTELASASDARIAKRTVSPSISLAPSTSQLPSNITATSLPAFTQTPSASGCETLTRTITLIETITLPGTTISITSTTIGATTLFEYPDVSPGTFKPTKTESAFTSALESPSPVQTPTEQPPAGTATSSATLGTAKPSQAPVSQVQPTTQGPAETSPSAPAALPSEEPQPTFTDGTTKLPQPAVSQPQPATQGPAGSSPSAPAAPPNEEPQPTSSPVVSIPGIGPISLAPGQQTTLGTHPISLDTSASFVVVDSTRTIPLPASTPEESTVPLSSLLSNLQPGHATVINDVTISLDPSSSAIVIGTSTVPLTAAPSAVVVPGPLPSGFSLVSASAGGGVVLPNGETLAPGYATTVAGVEVSVAAGTGGVVVVAGTGTVTVAANTDGGQGAPTSAAGDPEFTGGAGMAGGIRFGLPWWELGAAALGMLLC